MDLDNSTLVYQVLRYTFLDGESYSVQMELKHDIEDEKAEQIMLKASEQGLLEVVKDSDPQQYKVNFDELVERFYSYWQEEIGDFDTPVNFDNFLKGYIKSYFREEENSSLQEMLVEKLYLGLGNMESAQGLPKGLDEMHSEMSKKYEGPMKFRDHVQKGLDNS